MKSKKLTKQQLKVKQIIEDKKFNRQMLISFSLLSLIVILLLVFVTFWCDTKYNYRKFALYGKIVPYELVCMCENSLQYHESSKVVKENKTFYMCSSKCQEHLNRHFIGVANSVDAFSGDTICKADALIGLKERGKPAVVYFGNSKNFKNYYTTISKK